MLDIQDKVKKILSYNNEWESKSPAQQDGQVEAYRSPFTVLQNEQKDEEQKKDQNLKKSNPLNLFVKKDGSLVNPYMDYQKILDDTKVSQTTKNFITEATGLTPVSVMESHKNVSADSSFPGLGGGNRLGFISAKYESGGWNPGTISNASGDYGGVSYGIPQFSTTTGSAASFVRWLKSQNSEMGGYFGDAQPGTSAFNSAWKAVAEKYGDAFGNLQTQYAYNNMVAPLIQLAKEKTGVDYSRSPALRELAYSTAIQFGGGSLGLSALGNVSPNMSDADIINASYDKKIANYKSFFKSSSSDIQESVRKRFENERNDVLALVGSGTARAYNSSSSGASRYAKNIGTRISNTAAFNNDAAKGQCVWYVRGRMKEKLGKDTGAIGNANEMYYNAPARAKVTASAANLRPDMVVSYNTGSGSLGAKYGHVIYIEDVVGDTVYYTEGGSGYYKNGTDGVVKTASRADIMNGVNSSGAKIGSGVVGFIDVTAL